MVYGNFLYRVLSPAILDNSGAPDKETVKETRPERVETKIEADAATAVDEE
jgi:hypothetical protein